MQRSSSAAANEQLKYCRARQSKKDTRTRRAAPNLWTLEASFASPMSALLTYHCSTTYALSLFGDLLDFLSGLSFGARNRFSRVLLVQVNDRVFAVSGPLVVLKRQIVLFAIRQQE